MSEETKFPCTGCGLCCRMVGQAVEYARLNPEIDEPRINAVRKFPHSIIDGTCEMLGENNECKVYDDRPLICQINKVWATYWKYNMSLNQYHKKAAEACNKLIDASDIENKEEFYVNIQP